MMNKKILLFIGAILSVAMLTGCTSKKALVEQQEAQKQRELQKAIRTEEANVKYSAQEESAFESVKDFISDKFSAEEVTWDREGDITSFYVHTSSTPSEYYGAKPGDERCNSEAACWSISAPSDEYIIIWEMRKAEGDLVCCVEEGTRQGYISTDTGSECGLKHSRHGNKSDIIVYANPNGGVVNVLRAWAYNPSTGQVLCVVRNYGA